MFEDQGIKYEDIRIAPVEWPAVKKQLIESGENPVGQVPVVIVNKKVLTQSSAIFRYFARIYGLLLFLLSSIPVIKQVDFFQLWPS